MAEQHADQAEGWELGGGRGTATQVALLRRLDAENKLRYLRVEAPNAATGTPRQYVVDYGEGEVRLAGRTLAAWVRGFEAGLSARPAARRRRA